MDSILFLKTKGLKKINIFFAGHCMKHGGTIEHLGGQLDSKSSE